MQKRLLILLLLVVALAMFVINLKYITPALAAEDTKVDVYEDQKLVKSVVFAIGVDEYFVNGQTPGVKMDAAPYLDGGRTFVPVRFLGNAIGIGNENITWDSALSKATLVCPCGSEVEMYVGKKQIVTNGLAKDIDVAPQLKPPGRTFLPARFVVEALGFEVDWQDDKYVVVWRKGETKPDVSAVKEYVQEQAGQQPQGETFTTAAGYQIPEETKLNLPEDIKELGPGDPNDCEMDFNIDLTKGDLQSQWNDAAYILSQKIDAQTVEEVMAYVKQKTDWNQELMNKFWETTEKKVCVGSSWGSYGIQITVWYK